MSYVEQIENAIRQAPTLTATELVYTGEVYFDRHKPNIVLAEELDTYIDLLYIALQHVGYKDGIPYHAERMLRHENQHASVVQALGYETLAFGVRFYLPATSGTTACNFTPFINYGPVYDNLERAAIAGHPFDLSPGDKANVRADGFETIDDLGRAIIEYNQNRRFEWQRFIPLPLSYDPTPEQSA